MICRCFITNMHTFVLSSQSLYHLYKRSLLEYGSSIWNPGKYFIGLNKRIEKVQHKFTKQIYFRCNFIKTN